MPGGIEKTDKGSSTSSYIVRDVVRGLYEGRYVAGQRLVEPDLMSHYNVGRSTVREALKELSSDGIVVLAAFRGAQIRKLSREEAANLFSITEVVLGLAARQAAQKIEAPGARESIEELFRSIEEYRDEEGRFEFLRRRNRYFRQLVTISGNEEIHRILPRLQVHLIRNRLSVPSVERIEGYRKITEAVLSGDGAQAEHVARAYVAKTASFIVPHFPE
ncbi:MAG: GntR family transcriptional regulator [Heliomarina sp.]|uniref:GntR family transcriptional regulator n=1 Tax=Heliomarina sp. TaxID=2917556 RepID=UPI004059EA9A